LTGRRVHSVWALICCPRKLRLGAQTLCIAFLLILSTASSARADCSAAPIGDPDDMAISFLVGNGVQAASASLHASTTAEGVLVYDDIAKKLKLCDGDNWMEVGSGSGSDTLATLSCTAGEIAKYNGTGWACAADEVGGASVHAAGDKGQIQFNDGADGLAADANLHWDNTNKRLGIGTATPHISALLEVASTTQGLLPPRMTTAQRDLIGSPAEGLMIYNMTVKQPEFWDGASWVGFGSGAAVDDTPDAFNFTDQTDVALNTLTESNTITIDGITGSVAVSISGDGSPQLRINGGSWVTSGNISDGQTLQLRLTSDNNFASMLSAVVTVGTLSDQWDVTTVAQDTTPDAFSFIDQTDVALNTLTESNTLTINGITGSVAVSISGDGGPQLRVAGGSWGTSGSITNGQTLQLRLTSANSPLTLHSAIVSVGTVPDQWNVTTAYVCEVGETWTPRESTRPWMAVASSSDGTKLVAVAPGHGIFTSINSGATWTARETSRKWRAVASSSDGTKLVAVVDNGQIFTSTNSGATWVARASSRKWIDVASSADGNKLVAAVSSGQIYTSADSGATWTARGTERVRGVASSADGTKLVGIVSLLSLSQPGMIYTSADSGATWTTHEGDRQWRGVASSADGTKLVAVEIDGRIYTSSDSGNTWTARESNRQWNAVASSADGAKLVAAVSGGQIYTSACE